MTPSTVRRAALGAAIILCTAAPGAHAQSDTSAAVASGQTMLKLDAGTAKVLAANDIAVRLVSPAKSAKSGLTFPVAAKGSSLDPKTYAGTLNHTGGLRFQAGGKTLSLTRFRVKVGSSSSLSAVVNGGSRATIISLSTTKAKITRSGINTGARGIVARLSSTGAKALNAYFGVSLFTRGLTLGTVRSEARFGEIVFAGGETKLALDASTLTALGGLGVSPGIIAPATLAATTASFPITGGKVNAKTLAGSIRHSGGISLTAGATRVALTDFDIQLPKLLVKVNGGEPAPAIDLDAASAKVTVSGRNVTVDGVVAKLNAAGAGALSSAFGTTVPTVPLGVATVQGIAR
ncbi:MAG: hypothetical protein JHC95_07825 [Solirubrobacteraceae bacterium]|nr:hypothetical protein [Solirubrobacteraceae bacterium]